jgi:hypothetical protein
MDATHDKMTKMVVPNTSNSWRQTSMLGLLALQVEHFWRHNVPNFAE